MKYLVAINKEIVCAQKNTVCSGAYDNINVQIVEKVCCENPSILPIEKFNEFDCITQSEVFANIYLNKDLLEAAIGA